MHDADPAVTARSAGAADARLQAAWDYHPICRLQYLKVIGSCLPRHRAKEFIRFLNHLEKEVPLDQDIHLIMDNYSTHKSAAVQRWLRPKKQRCFHFHFTPTSSS
jgi:chorismate mutase